MRVWRKKQKWQVIAALLFAVWILMETRKINCRRQKDLGDRRGIAPSLQL